MNEMTDYIMDNFDFEKVQAAMSAVNWKWTNKNGKGYRLPSVSRLKETARMLLEGVEGGKTVCYSTGGFTAHKDEDGVLYLEFILEEYNTSDE